MIIAILNRITNSITENIFFTASPLIISNYSKIVSKIEWHRNANGSLLGCDFFSKKIWTLRGRVEAFVLVVVHSGSQRIYLSPTSFNPNNAWLEQQVRNVAMWCEDENIESHFMIHDNDGKYKGTCDAALKNIDVTAVLTPIAAPNTNTFVESWISNACRECLEHFIYISVNQLNNIVSAYSYFFNKFRPHQGRGIGNRVLDKAFQPQTESKVSNDIDFANHDFPVFLANSD